jgi:hypothetical protein
MFGRPVDYLTLGLVVELDRERHQCVRQQSRQRNASVHDCRILQGAASGTISAGSDGAWRRLIDSVSGPTIINFPLFPW